MRFLALCFCIYFIFIYLYTSIYKHIKGISFYLFVICIHLESMNFQAYFFPLSSSPYVRSVFQCVPFVVCNRLPNGQQAQTDLGCLTTAESETLSFCYWYPTVSSASGFVALFKYALDNPTKLCISLASVSFAIVRAQGPEDTSMVKPKMKN